MQMSSLYESTNRKLRASKMRTDARENERRGFPGFAEALWQLAEWIDPTPREKPEPVRRARPQRQPSQQHRNTPVLPVNQRSNSSNAPHRAAPVVEFKRKTHANSTPVGNPYAPSGYTPIHRHPPGNSGRVPSQRGSNQLVVGSPAPR